MTFSEHAEALVVEAENHMSGLSTTQEWISFYGLRMEALKIKAMEETIQQMRYLEQTVSSGMNRVKYYQ